VQNSIYFIVEFVHVFQGRKKIEFKAQKVSYFGSNITRQRHLAVCASTDNYVLLSP